MAIRTNSKKAKKRIREYLMDYVTEMMDEREIETETPVTEFMKIMNEEAKYGCVNRNANEFDRFVYWLQGLAGFGADIYYFSSDAEYGYSKCRKILAVWLE